MSNDINPPTITEFLLARIAEDEAVAQAASGSTVEGAVGSWAPVPGGDEWAAHEGDLEVEVLVALRPGLPLPPRVMEGKWGQLAYWETYDADHGTLTPVAQHIARHDPAHVLRECVAKRAIISVYESAFTAVAMEAGADVHMAWSGMSKGFDLVFFALASVYSDHPDYRPDWEL